MSLINWIDFYLKENEKGKLVSIEQNINIPFEIKRVYCIVNLKLNEPRGFHAHKNLQQVIVCVSGSCKILFDDGISKEVVSLDSIDRGLLIDRKVWHEMYDFSEECVLLVVASENYDELDYIRNYDEFINTIIND